MTGYLEQVLEMRRAFQRFLDENAAGDWDDKALTALFTLGDGMHPVTEEQLAVLLDMAPDNVRQMNA